MTEDRHTSEALWPRATHVRPVTPWRDSSLQVTDTGVGTPLKNCIPWSTLDNNQQVTSNYCQTEKIIY